MLPLDAYLALRKRPLGPVAMHQSWHDLLFLHCAVAPEMIQAQLPAGLEVDTFEGRAYLGLVPFRMSQIRPRNLPAMPWLSEFPETNVRTYVHRDGIPGVWFFSLDAARLAACTFARRFFSLPYHHARMSVARSETGIEYESHRPGADLMLSTELPRDFAPVEPGTLDFFLVERYLLFAQKRGQLFRGQVHHEPYQIAPITEVQHCEQSLTKPFGVVNPIWDHICFSPGVTVDVFALSPA